MNAELKEEIFNNFAKFDKSSNDDQAKSRDSIGVSLEIFKESFLRICTIQACRVHVIKNDVSIGAQAFFFEAQNDLLASHHLARCGANRQALKSLRSAIENVYFCLYYKDHPIELEKWESGTHRAGFTELHSYLEGHPHLGQPLSASALAALKDEYATLSKAVHGSAKQFRMTKNLEEITLWTADAAETGKWGTRQRIVIENLNSLLACMFHSKLQGAANSPLREVLALTLGQKRKASYKKELSISL